jgi:UDP-N-acetylmuramoyl-L-alanyl-D-glutamate--2,6-diaminopimelate ligase
MENIPGPASFNVIVDYAHTPDGLSQVLQAVRKFTSRKIILVFGCGGDRDTSKRPAMGEIAAGLADVAVITSDNPRSENPEKIIRDIVAGARKLRPGGRGIRSLPENKILVEIDRARAIRTALRLAGREDTVLIAGKGHEKYQILAHQTIPFDDRRIVRQELARLNRRGKCKV